MTVAAVVASPALVLAAVLGWAWFAFAVCRALVRWVVWEWRVYRDARYGGTIDLLGLELQPPLLAPYDQASDFEWEEDSA